MSKNASETPLCLTTYTERRAAKAIGCGGWTRTSDHRINNPALYQLSYTTPMSGRADIVACPSGSAQVTES